MSDVKEALAEAKARWRRVAAARLIRKEELEAVIAGGGAGAEAAAEELAVVAGELQTALDELDALDRLAAQAPAGEARAIAASVEEDPFAPSHEQRALDGAREYVKELDAQVRLNSELGAETSPEPARPPSKGESEAKARAAFEELRAKSNKPKKTL